MFLWFHDDLVIKFSSESFFPQDTSEQTIETIDSAITIVY